MNKKIEQVPDCSSIFQLQTVDEISYISDDQLLFLVSEKYPYTETGYISKNLKYQDLIRASYNSLSLEILENDIKTLSGDVNDWNDFKNRYLSTFGTLKCNIENPYIISAIQLSNGIMVGVSGYFLSTGINTCLNIMKIKSISAENGYFDNGYFDEISTENLSTKYLYINGKKITYEEMVKDQFLNDVQVISNKMIFNFKLTDGNPKSISTDLSDFAGQVGFRNWLV